MYKYVKPIIFYKFRCNEKQKSFRKSHLQLLQAIVGSTLCVIYRHMSVKGYKNYQASSSSECITKIHVSSIHMQFLFIVQSKQSSPTVVC